MNRPALRTEDCFEPADLNSPRAGRFLRWMGTTGESARECIGPCYLWIAEGVRLDQPWCSVVSSRIGRHPHRRPDWFHMLERAIENTAGEGAAILNVQGTAAARWVGDACELFRVPQTRVSVSGWSGDVDRWIEEQQSGNSIVAISVSPPIGDTDSACTLHPRRDVFSVMFADRVYAPLVRAGGNVDDLLRARIADGRFAPGSVWVSIHSSPAVARSLIECGAVGCLDSVGCGDEPASGSKEQSSVKVFELEEFLRLEEHGAEGDWDYLVHCTRERSGRWPSQSERAYRDELFLGDAEAGSGPLAALKRILQRQRIEGTSRVTRGESGVVCFSANRIDELLAARTYRSHVGRWDFEPYGLAIRRDALQRQQARRVIYGDDAVFETLAPDERAFFQSQGDRHDWTQENEWRVAGDVLLRDIAEDEAFVFVSERSEAKEIAPVCPWPIVVACV